MRVMGEGETASAPGPDGVVLHVSVRELALLSNAVGESLEAVEEWEFQTRLGEDRDAAKQVRASIKTALSAARGR